MNIIQVSDRCGQCAGKSAVLSAAKCGFKSVQLRFCERHIHKLREMNLGELVEALDLQEKQSEYMTLTFDERMNLAVDYTYSAKYNAKVHRLIKAAKFRIADAALVNVYYEKRGLDRDLILTLGNCGFIEKNQPVVFNGFTDSGKSYLACAIGRQACMQGFRTRYIRVPDLMQPLSEASLDVRGRTKLLKKFSGYRLLILDEWLLNDMTENEQHFFFELIERRYDCTSTIFCTQYKREDWHSRLGGGIHADAIMDRIVHTAAWVYSGDINMRELQAKEAKL